MTKGKKQPLHIRFWEKVGPMTEDGCLPWNGWTPHKDPGRQYGAILDREFNTVRMAHRLAWEFRYGPLEEGDIVMHTCDHPWCVNPEHLRRGTQEENIGDAIAKGRWRNDPEHAPRPHYSQPSLLNSAQAEYVRLRFKKGSHLWGAKPMAKRLGVPHNRLRRWLLDEGLMTIGLPRGQYAYRGVGHARTS